jgi:hypothetical protein
MAKIEDELAILKRQIAELCGLRDEVSALKSALADARDELDGLRAEAAPESDPPGSAEIPAGTWGVFHATAGRDFPAVVVQARVVRDGFPLRYRLYVIFHDYVGYQDDIREGAEARMFTAAGRR